MSKFSKFVTPSSVAKSSKEFLSDKELDTNVLTVMKELTSSGIKIIREPTSLGAKEAIGEKEALPKTFSLPVGLGFTNVSANGNVYHSNNKVTRAIGYFKDQEFTYAKGSSVVLNEIKDFQTDKLS